jgi:hypothetical protein
VAVGLTVLALGGAATASGCGEELEKSLDKLEKSTKNNKKLNKEIAQIPLGASVDSVKQKLGKPESFQQSESSLGKEENLYYGQWQLNFSDGKLESKNKY